jgi:dihydropteroate synthase
MGARAVLGGVEVGDDRPVAVVGALNVSPESFYGGSVWGDPDALVRAARRMVEAGAALVDVGAMSSAPYRSTWISEAEETDRLARAVEALVPRLPVPVSADTWRAGPARAALEAGAAVINDVTGLTGDPALAPLVARSGAGLILMAHGGRPGGPSDAPIPRVLALLGESLALAREAGIAGERIAVDPGIGFFRAEALPWHEWDCRVLAELGALGALGRPLSVGVSRKSFIGLILGQEDPADRLEGSLAAAAIAVFNGAHLVRCHDVAETRRAVRLAEAVRARV